MSVRGPAHGDAAGGGNMAAPTTGRPKIVSISRKYPLRILLAEDNLINQKMMVMMMRKLGYEMVVASNGQEVLQILEREAFKGKQHEIECILMDASMDVMDGMECTRVIRAQQLPHRTRPFIIAQTANVTEEYRVMCLDAGMVIKQQRHEYALGRDASKWGIHLDSFEFSFHFFFFCFFFFLLFFSRICFCPSPFTSNVLLLVYALVLRSTSRRSSSNRLSSCSSSSC